MLAIFLDTVFTTLAYVALHQGLGWILRTYRDEIRAVFGVTMTNFELEASSTGKTNLQHVLTATLIVLVRAVKPVLYTLLYALTYRFVDMRQVSEFVYVYNLMCVLGYLDLRHKTLRGDLFVLAVRVLDLVWLACSFGSPSIVIPLVTRLLHDAQYTREWLLALLYAHEALIVSSTRVGETLRRATLETARYREITRKLYTLSMLAVLLWCLSPNTTMNVGVVGSYYFSALTLAQGLRTNP